MCNPDKVSLCELRGLCDLNVLQSLYDAVLAAGLLGFGGISRDESLNKGGAGKLV